MNKSPEQMFADEVVSHLATKDAANMNNADLQNRIVGLESKLDAIAEVIRETRDDFAPDHPPYDVTDLLERLETAMGDG